MTVRALVGCVVVGIVLWLLLIDAGHAVVTHLP